MYPRLMFAVLACLACDKSLAPEAARLECRVKALTPLAGTVDAARELAQTPTDKLNLPLLAQVAGKSAADAAAARKRLVECEAGPDASTSDGG